jgi:hypothetical protein
MAGVVAVFSPPISSRAQSFDKLKRGGKNFSSLPSQPVIKMQISYTE